MPNSLKCRLKKFVHKGLLSENDFSRIYTDNDVIEELEKIRNEITMLLFFNRENVVEVIETHISELKGENK